MGPLTYYPSKWFIENKLKAIRWIVRRVEAVVGRRLARFKGLTLFINSPGALQPLHHDTWTNACRLIFHVPTDDAERWVQLTRGYGRNRRVVWEARLSRALQMYAMSSDARGPEFMRHAGNVEITGSVLTGVLTFPDGVDLDAALWDALEREFGATHAAGAGAPRRTRATAPRVG